MLSEISDTKAPYYDCNKNTDLENFILEELNPEEICFANYIINIFKKDLFLNIMTQGIANITFLNIFY